MAQAREAEKSEVMEPIVVSATLMEQKLSETPSTVQVISKEQIQQMGADSVAQALQEAVGMTLSTESGRVVRPSIRGTGPFHTLVLVDGRRLALGFRGMSDINQIPPVMIERIEIIRGPTSALFGSDAVGGVINIITKKPPRKKTVAGLDLKAGTNTRSGGDAFAPQAYVGSDLGPFRFILGGEHVSRNGWDYDNEPPDDGDDLKQQYVSGQAAIDLGERHALSFGGSYNDFKRTGARDLQNKVTEREATDETSDVFLRYDGAFTDKYNLMLQAYHTRYSLDIGLTPEISDPFSSNEEEYTRTQYEGRFSAKINQNITATAGAEYREDKRGADSLSPEYENHNTAGFGQLDMLFLERLNLVAGVRWDDHSEFGSEWSPRVALSWIFNDYLRLKGGYGHGFRAPIPYELYVTSYRRQGKDVYLANPDLKAETSRTYEAGLQASLPAGKGLNLELTYFHIDIDDMIESVLQSRTAKGATYKYENISEAETSGVEFLAQLRLPYGWNLGASLTYLDSENAETGERLAYQPEIKGNVNAQWHIDKLGLWLRASYTWWSGMEDGAGGSLDDSSSLDAWIGKDLPAGVQLYAGMKNVLDQDDTYNVSPPFVYLGVKWDY
ncbi:hypothetical protein AAU61_17340 [Desulfocarbo indianensis]|nr:hypothetical protein AAU61_17340 [Desulfocarbo indianensis]